MKLFDRQQILEEEDRNFVDKHRDIINFYVYFFIGCFLVFFIIAMIAPSHVFSLDDLKGVSGKATEATKAPPLPGASNQSMVISVFKNNVYVMLIAFLLSIFYGAGSLFLLTFNGSIFASALVKAIRLKIPHAASFIFTYSFIGCNLGTIFLHLIPEVGAYFLAAIAGGIISTGIMKDQLGSSTFNKTIKDALILLVASIIILFVGAAIEMNVSRAFFLGNVCSEYVNPVSLFWGFVIVLIIILEIIRRFRAPPTEKKIGTYVKKCRDSGHSDESIQKKLLSHGFNSQHVDKALKKK